MARLSRRCGCDMSYLTARRFGLTRIEPNEQLRASGWRQVWEHPSGLLALRHPVTGRWVIGDGYSIRDGFSSSLRAAAATIVRIKVKGTCNTCGETHSLTPNGRVVTHSDPFQKSRECKGSRDLPEPDGDDG